MKPSALFNFAKAKTLGSRITFLRGSYKSQHSQAGVISYAGFNEPCFDHDPTTGKALGLSIHQSYTNKVVYSELFADTIWTKTRASVTKNVLASPDGTTTADKLVEDGTVTNSHLTTQTITALSTVHRFAVFAKAGERTRVQTRFAGGAGDAAAAAFNLSTGAIANETQSSAQQASNPLIVDYPDGYYRCSINCAAASGYTNVGIFLDNGTSHSYSGDSTSGAYIWGAQVTEGEIDFPYAKPHQSSGAAVEADLAKITGTHFSSVINPLGSSVVCGFRGQASGTSVVWQMDDGTADERITLSASSGTLTLTVVDGGVTQATLSLGTIVTGTDYVVACAWAANDIAACVDGGTVVTDTSATLPTLTQMRLGTDGTNYLNSTIAKIATYPVRLSDATLKGLSA
jgi:hypothetical protein